MSALGLVAEEALDLGHQLVAVDRGRVDRGERLARPVVVAQLAADGVVVIVVVIVLVVEVERLEPSDVADEVVVLTHERVDPLLVVVRLVSEATDRRG